MVVLLLTLRAPEEDRCHPALEREQQRETNSCNLPTSVFPLAITIHYSQSPGGREPIDAGALLAHNGKIAVYSQYFQRVFWVFAYEAGELYSQSMETTTTTQSIELFMTALLGSKLLTQNPSRI